MYVARQNLDWHLESCQPYCDPCYQQWVLRRRQTVALKWYPYCRCKPVPPQNLNECIWRGRQRFHKTPHVKTLCRDCSDVDADIMLKRRNERTRSDLRRGRTAKGEKWTKCGRPECENELSGAGPRWWVCRNDRCQKECTSLTHDAWRRSQSSEKTSKAPWYSRWYCPVLAPEQSSGPENV